MALSRVFKCHIILIYPPENGVQDQTSSTLNTIVGDATTTTVRVMWTGPKVLGQTIWAPNHVVPVVSSKEDAEHHLSSDDTTHSDFDQDEDDASTEREDSKTDEEVSDSDSSETKEAEDEEDGRTELPHGRVTELESSLGNLQNMPDTDAGVQVPPGKRENVHFVGEIANSQN